MDKANKVIFFVCLFSILTVSGNVFGEAEDRVVIIASQEEESQESQPINLYFYGGDGGELKVDLPEGNSSTDIPCPGSPTPRIMGLLVGIWTSPAINTMISVGSRVTCGLWAKTAQSANNVRFNCQILKNGNLIMDIYTESQSLSNTPTEFSGENTYDGSIELGPGDTIGARVYYFADPQYGIGKAPDATLIVGSVQCDTHITITTSPLTMAIQEPVVSSQLTTISVQISDAFGATKYQAHIIIDGMTDAETVSNPTVSPGGNGTIVSWNWDHRIDKAKDGEYKIIISISYSEENEFITMGVYQLTFPKDGDEQGGLSGLGEWLIPIFVIVIIVIIVAVVYKIISDRRLSRDVV